MSEPLIEVNSASKSFGGRKVLDGASLWSHRGEISALLGRNGCGKTTLLRIATGELLPEMGNVRFRGEYQARPRLHVLARAGLGYLPSREYLPANQTLRETFALCAWPDRPMDDVIAELQLSERLGHMPHELSGGELRRAELASLLIVRPLCLLVDEPFRGIAPADCELIIAVLRRYAAAGGSAVVTGHERVFMLAVADQVLWCHDGTTEGVGSPAEAVQHFRFRQAYLGPTY